MTDPKGTGAAGTGSPQGEARRPRLALATACATQFICVLDVSIVNVALPAMRESLSLSPAGLQWVVNGYALTFAGFLLLGGRAADLLGRRRVFVTGVMLFTVASLAGGLAQDGWQLVTARLVQGLGGAILAPTTLSLVTTTFVEPRARAKALAVLTGAAGAGGALGGVIGGLLTGLLSWRWVLFVNVPLGVLLVLAAMWALAADARGPVRGRLDLPGSIAVTGGTGSLVAAIVVSEQHGWFSTPTMVLLGVAGALLLSFLVRERHAAHPLVPLAVFRIRPLTTANGLAALIGGVLPATMFFVSLHLQQGLDMSPLHAGLALLPSAAGIALGAWAASRLLARLGARAAFLVGCGLAAGGLVWLSTIRSATGYALPVAVPLFLAMAGLGLSGLPLTVTATSGVGRHWAGLASGLLNSAKQVGGAVGLAVLVTVATTQTAAVVAEGRAAGQAAAALGYGTALLVGAGLMAVAAVGGLALPRAAGARAVSSEEVSRAEVLASPPVPPHPASVPPAMRERSDHR